MYPISKILIINFTVILSSVYRCISNTINTSITEKASSTYRVNKPCVFQPLLTCVSTLYFRKSLPSYNYQLCSSITFHDQEKIKSTHHQISPLMIQLTSKLNLYSLIINTRHIIIYLPYVLRSSKNHAVLLLLTFLRTWTAVHSMKRICIKNSCKRLWKLYQNLPWWLCKI